MTTKGIILAGGTGSRLYPLTIPITKQLLPIYDKPLIYYPLATLLEAGITEICIITTPQDAPQFKALLKDGSQLGISIHYETQDEPKGIAQAFIIAENFIGDDQVVLILGDNLFYGDNISAKLEQNCLNNPGGTVYGYYVQNPNAYGVAKFDSNNRIIEIIEKPEVAPSPYAITGLYIYSNDVVSIAKNLAPSKRGELEITDVNNHYIKQKTLRLQTLDRGCAWLDTGTPENMLDASHFVETIEKRQGLKIACIEEIAYKKGYITKSQLENLAEPMTKNQYGQYLLKIIDGY
jgi:glucose-1-phosphate thymidylyltransferase